MGALVFNKTKEKKQRKEEEIVRQQLKRAPIIGRCTTGQRDGKCSRRDPGNN